MRRLLLAAMLLSLSLPVRALDPIGEIGINLHALGWQGVPSVAMDSAGRRLVAVWLGEGPEGMGVYGRLLGSHQFLVATSVHELGLFSAVAMDGSGFVVAWNESGPSGSVLYGRSFRSNGAALGRPYPIAAGCCGQIALGADGRILAVGLDTAGLFARLLNRNGQPAGERVALGGVAFGDVASLGSRGYVVTWSEAPRVLMRLLGPDGAPLGSAIPVAGGLEFSAQPGVAAAPDGRFVVTWSTFDSVSARVFSPAGAPLTGTVNVAKGMLLTQGRPEVAMDAAGRFVVAWTTGSGSHDDYEDIWARRFEASGNPVGAAFRLNDYTLQPQHFPGVAAGPAGFFFAIWESGYLGPSFGDQDGNAAGIFGRSVAWAHSGSDPCAFNSLGFACDSAFDRGRAEVEIPFSGAPGDRPLLGDLDGDGRDDPCLFQGDRFLCDTNHDGFAEVEIVYGQAGDAPLLGDLDGEGRDDACVRRGTLFLCDTRHNGGTAEMVVNFGAAGGVPLLGDLDGDGDDDPCVRQGSTFLCDTVHDGLEGEVSISFGEPKDLPLLGDLDGDGRDDPCVVRKGRLLCDTAHNGGAAELSFRLSLPGMPLLGNVDGV